MNPPPLAVNLHEDADELLRPTLERGGTKQPVSAPRCSSLLLLVLLSADV